MPHTTQGQHIQIVRQYLRRFHVTQPVVDSFNELVKQLQAAEAASDRLTLHCMALESDLDHGLTRSDLKDELSQANNVALGLVDPYERGGRIPY